jgi:hypothetical protein
VVGGWPCLFIDVHVGLRVVGLGAYVVQYRSMLDVPWLFTSVLPDLL